jgi:hypothetical protein
MSKSSKPTSNSRKVKVFCKINDPYLLLKNDKEEILNQKNQIFSASDEVG